LTITFEITDNMKAVGIESFSLNRRDFELSITGGKRCCIDCSSKESLAHHLKGIERRLLQELGDSETKDKLIESAIQDIENQLVERRDEIYGMSSGDGRSCSDSGSNSVNPENHAKSKYIEKVKEQRKKFKESDTTYEQWQSIVAEKYGNLRKVAAKHYPEAWILLEFCLAVKSILNIEGFTLPFMGVILAPPSSMKTKIIQLFRKYPGSFYTDSFTPNSLISHNSSLSEEKLQQVDMIPKIKSKLVLAPELAPIFTSKEDELQKTLGMLTRLLDGNGLESDSGAQGHRRYGDTMFVWLGAAVEIPPRVWKLLGTLGHKIYFLRPSFRKKTIEDLKTIAKTNNLSANIQEVEEALLDYLIIFDAAPEANSRIRLDENGIVKVRWSEEVMGEQEKAIECISQIGNLLAPLRGTVYINATNHRSKNGNGNINKDSQEQDSFAGQDYESDFPIIEDPSRAVTLLRNLAIGHAVSQGRDSINLQDVPLVIKVALSTSTRRRVEVLDLLLRKKGELLTSDITNGLIVSEPTARRAIREFHALGIADISTVAGYANTELKMTLRSEYDWFKSKDFEQLRHEEEVHLCHGNEDGKINSIVTERSSASGEEPDLPHPSSFYKSDQIDNNKNNTVDMEACDVNYTCHTLKINSPPGTEHNNAICCDIQSNQQLPPQQRSQSDHDVLRSDDSINNIYRYTNNNNYINTDTCNQHTLNTVTSSNTSDHNIEENNDNKASPWGSNHFQHVTPSHCHTQTEALTDEASFHKTYADEGKEEEEKDELLALQEILALTKEANGSQAAFNTLIELAYNKSQQVRDYLKDQKLTSRDSRKVRNLSIKTIRHENIIVVKHKPQLVVRWSSNDNNTSNADKSTDLKGNNIEVQSDNQTNKEIDS
jgi:hypothetical protein